MHELLLTVHANASKFEVRTYCIVEQKLFFDNSSVPPFKISIFEMNKNSLFFK